MSLTRSPLGASRLGDSRLADSPPVDSPLVDSHGRRMKKLRVSLLDHCNFRCFYCMPVRTKFQPPSTWLSPEQIDAICTALVGYGIGEIRLTGGEPTLRPELADIAHRLGKLPLSKLGITTNGMRLEPLLADFKKAGVTSINVSLDSLDPFTFKAITRNARLETVIAAIHKAKALGFEVKVNCVALKGINDGELLDFVQFSKDTGVEVRFLELMTIGEANSHHSENFLPAIDMLATISRRYDVVRIPSPPDATAVRYRSADGVKIGFIASETMPFCGGCSRWRLTATGKLRACLMAERGVDLNGVAPEDYPPLLDRLLGMKPIGRIAKVEQTMNQIGG